jgi:acyl-coenzyme A synthetase/AMP-(fatty) acid ligase
VIWAFVEVRDAAPDVESLCASAVVERLGRVARPSVVRRVARLPHLPNGKVDRQMLVAWARSIGHGGQGPV